VELLFGVQSYMTKSQFDFKKSMVLRLVLSVHRCSKRKRSISEDKRISCQKDSVKIVIYPYVPICDVMGCLLNSEDLRGR
jgi:hypothetical protein